MKFGVAIFFTDYSIKPTILAQAIEERGFESLWCPEHSHIPISRISEWPQEGNLPQKYYDVMDPFVTLSQAAAVTDKLKIATGICLVPQRDPIQTAKEVASLDSLSNGRFLMGVGSGWNKDELAHHGTDFNSRHKVLQERVEAMRIIWSNNIAEYNGSFVNFSQMKTWPKPSQKPGPPIYVGGEFPHGARRALTFGDGWLPHAKRPHYDLLDILPQFKQMETEFEKTPGSTPISVFGVDPDIPSVDRYHEAKVERLIFNLPPDDANGTLTVLDEWAKLIS